MKKGFVEFLLSEELLTVEAFAYAATDEKQVQASALQQTKATTL